MVSPFTTIVRSLPSAAKTRPSGVLMRRYKVYSPFFATKFLPIVIQALIRLDLPAEAVAFSTPLLFTR